MPARRACSSPGASGRLEMTTAIRASRRPSSIASISARRLVPRPEMRTPIGPREGRIWTVPLAVSDTVAVLDLSDGHRVRFTGGREPLEHPIRLTPGADHDEPDAHVESAQHVLVGHGSLIPEPFEHGGHLPRAAID